LANSRTGNSQALLQLGWGTGWDDKTFGSNLRKDDDFMGSFIQHFRLARGRRERGEFFPKSRLVAVSTTRSSKDQIHETPMKPLGWVLLEIKPK
jgi:CRISPR-associated protein Csm5